jgi:hypothetical protein
MKNVVLNYVSLLMNAPVSKLKGVWCRQVTAAAAAAADRTFSDRSCLNIYKQLASLMRFFVYVRLSTYCAFIPANLTSIHSFELKNRC